MKKIATVSEALKKACIYQKRPQIPTEFTDYFKGCTHCEIHSYHQKINLPRQNGNLKKTRRYTGIIFIFLLLESGNRLKEPLRIMHKENMTRRDFVSYARKFTTNTDNLLSHALSQKTH